mgnify:CR=1 FL=1
MKGVPLLVMVAAVVSQVPAAELETSVWQERIDACAKAGGGRVTVSEGTHVVGQLYLRSNVELHLEKGASLQGARGLGNYTLHRLPYSEGDWAAVVMGLNVTNVAITGEGEVFGDGAGFEQVERKGVCPEGFRPRGIFFSQAKGIRLEGFTLRDAACWGVVFKCCEDVVARRVTVNSHANLNNDGFDIEARNVLIEDCDVDSGDDAYCVKSNDPSFVVEDVTVRNCIARSHCNGFKIGTATHGTVRRVRFEHCHTEAPRRTYRDLVPMPKDLRKPVIPDGAPWYLFGPGIDAICIECVDGGTVEDVVADDIEVRGFTVPIFVRGGSRTGRTCGTPPGTAYCFRNVVISNVRGQAEGTIPSTVTGCAKCRPKDVHLENIDIACFGDDKQGSPFSEPGPEFDGCYPGSLMFQLLHLPSYGLYVDRWSDVSFKKVRFSLRDGERDERPAVFCRSEGNGTSEGKP